MLETIVGFVVIVGIWVMWIAALENDDHFGG